MKINDINRVGAINPYRRNYDAHNAQAAGKKGKQKDEVQISPEAKELLDAQSAGTAVERDKRIQELKQSVSTGTYHVDANKIAEKLLPYFGSSKMNPKGEQDAD